MTYDANPAPLVDTEWLQEHLGDPKIRVVEVDEDTTAYRHGHIPGAVGWDWKADLHAAVGRNFVDQDGLSKLLGEAGVERDTTVVFYGGNSNWFAAYAYWLVKHLGFDNIRLLDGGRKRWTLEGRELTDEVPRYQRTHFTLRGGPRPEIRAYRDEVLGEPPDFTRAYIDVRSPEEYRGEMIAPAGLSQEAGHVPGHIPGAINVPWSKAVNDDGTFKSVDELRKLYQSAHLTPDRKVITYCRIGERSSHTWFVLNELLGFREVKNYDGSWTEYGSMVGVPVERGEARVLADEGWDEDEIFRGPADRVPTRGLHKLWRDGDFLGAEPSISPDTGEDAGRLESFPSLPTTESTAHRERRISVWVGDDPAASPPPLEVGVPAPVSFMVGDPVAASVATGTEALVPDPDIPAEGLDTSWVVWSSDLLLAPLSPGTSVEGGDNAGTLFWTAKFDLHVPRHENSVVVRVMASALRSDQPRMHALVYVGTELYRQLTLVFPVRSPANAEPGPPATVTVESDNPRTRAAHLSITTPHEWTTPPGRLSLVIQGDMATLKGTSMGPQGPFGLRTLTTEPGQPEPWVGVASRVDAPLAKLIDDAERFRAKHESYLNDLPPADLLTRLANPNHQYDWGNFQIRADPAHEQAWHAVRTSDELRSLATSGQTLYNSVFPTGSRMRKVLEFLTPGHRIDIDWTPQGNFVPHMPWGLLYLGDVPAKGQPVDPTGFFGLRFRIGYTSHLIPGGTGKALGRLDTTHGAHLMYQGDPAGAAEDAVAAEATWQRSQWASWANQILVPSGTGNPLVELQQLLANPGPAPVAVLYLYCQSGGQPSDPLLRFGPPAHPYDLTRNDLGGRQIQGEPLVFANACSTATVDPYVAGVLEETFFGRGCRGYVGTETKVPITLASRFALIFFHYFYRRIVPEPISAGEAVAQARLFLWTNYRNLGGLFYAYVNNYEVFMADDGEIQAMKAP